MMTNNKYKILGFSLTFITSLIIYFYTMSPTLALWDCGEFIAASYSLGIPHPPGTPLVILIGRVFSLIPLGTIAQRITFVSVLTAALGAGFMYLIMLQIMEYFGKLSGYLKHLSAIVGSLVAAFSFSVWFSAVEAEVYSLNNFVILLLVWLCLRWARNFQQGSHRTWRWVLLILFIGALSVGIHLQPVLVMVGILIFGLWLTKGREEYRDLVMGSLFLGLLLLVFYLAIKITIETGKIGWATPLMLAAVGAVFLYLAYRWLGKYSWSRILMLTMVTLLGLSSYFYLMVRAHNDPAINESDPKDVKGLWEVFSRKQYGENNPFKRRIAYPEMWNNGEDLGFNGVEGMIHDIRIYFRYFNWQYTPWAREGISGGMISLWISLLYLTIGIIGAVRLWYGDRRLFMLMWLTFFLFSLGIVFYLNMRFIPSDPSYLRPQEVRERDYFFGSAYQWWGFFIGFGFLWLGEVLRLAFVKFFTNRQKLLNSLMTVFGVVLILIPLMGNRFSRANRRGDWMAEDYGYNILISCTRPGILFTNGDNDTFPLWFQQEVLGTRKFDPQADTGIIVANFSLLNTNWYVKQIYQQGLPMGLASAFQGWEVKEIPVVNASVSYSFENPTIDPWNEYVYSRHIQGNADLASTWNQLNRLEKQQLGINITDSCEVNFNLWLIDQLIMGKPLEFMPVAFALYQGEIVPVEIMLPKDITLRAIITGINHIELTPELLFLTQEEFAQTVGPQVDTNATFSVYFSSTCSRENMANFTEHLLTEGMVYRLVPTRHSPQTPIGTLERVNYELTEDLYLNQYRYRGVFNPSMLNATGNLKEDISLDNQLWLDPDVFRGVEAQRISSNYAAGFFILGTNILTQMEAPSSQELETALLYLKIGNLINLGNETQFTYFITDVYKMLGEKDSAIALIDRYLSNTTDLLNQSYLKPEVERYSSGIGFFTAKKIFTLIYFGDYGKAEKLFSESISLLNATNQQDLIILQSYFSFFRGDSSTALSVLESAGLYQVDYEFIDNWLNQSILKEIGDTAFVEFITSAYVRNTMPPDQLDSVDSMETNSSVDSTDQFEQDEPVSEQTR
ncbi:MAG: glycosyltransferase family 117 protein [bacterium]